MELNDIIDAINNGIDPRKGILVLQRSMQPHPTFKIYKIFTYSLYNIVGEKHCIHNIQIAKNSPADEILKNWKESDKEYLQDLIKFIASPEYKKLTYVQ